MSLRCRLPDPSASGPGTANRALRRRADDRRSRLLVAGRDVLRESFELFAILQDRWVVALEYTLEHVDQDQRVRQRREQIVQHLDLVAREEAERQLAREDVKRLLERILLVVGLHERSSIRRAEQPC